MGVYYKKTHKIAGINFLPRLTLAEYNNLTVKPEHWIRTDSPFDYSKTDVPKLTLTQYEDLAIKPKFWIRTDAPQSYTNISATQVDMTDSVSVFDYLDDLNAEQVSYDSNNSVKDKIDGIAEQISISDTSYTIGATCYKIGKLVIISCYVVDYPANGILLTLPNDLKPSSNVSLGREWLMTDSSNWGSKEFILFPSGNIGCASAIYRGSVKLFYYTS